MNLIFMDRNLSVNDGAIPLSTLTKDTLISTMFPHFIVSLHVGFRQIHSIIHRVVHPKFLKVVTEFSKCQSSTLRLAPIWCFAAWKCQVTSISTRVLFWRDSD